MFAVMNSRTGSVSVNGKEAYIMDSTVIVRVVASVLAAVVLAVIVYRRKQKTI